MAESWRQLASDPAAVIAYVRTQTIGGQDPNNHWNRPIGISVPEGGYDIVGVGTQGMDLLGNEACFSQRFPSYLRL